MTVYELRVYKMLPKFFPSYVKLTNELLHLRTAHSELSGFWLTEIGGQNEAVHIWRYDSVMHRKSVRDALGGDTAWQQQYMAPVREFWAEQQNWVMEAVGEAKEERQKFPFYGLRLGEQRTTPFLALDDTTSLVQTFNVVSGDGTMKQVELVGSNSMDSLIKCGAQSTSDHHRILLPAPWSDKLKCTWY